MAVSVAAIAQATQSKMMKLAESGSLGVQHHECIPSSSSCSLYSSTSFSPHRHSTCTGGLRSGSGMPHSCSSSSCSSSSSRSPLVTCSVAIGAHRGGMKQWSHVRAASGSVQAEVATIGTLSVGQAALQGPRDEMEDEVVVVEPEGLKGFLYAGVFDGHAGLSSARFLRDELYKECVAALEGGSLLESEDLQEAEEALSGAFLQADKRLISRLETIEVGAEKESGSTATVLLAGLDRLVIAYVGDSRVVLSRNGKAEDLTSDHRPFGRDKRSFAEIKRIQEAGGWVSHGRVCGYLSVTRAFGDIQLKTQKQQMLDQGVQERRWTQAFASSRNVDGDWVVATPDTCSMSLDEGVDFVIVASDGLWDSFKSADAVQYVRKQLREHGDVQLASEKLAQEALDRYGQDNVSVVIVDFGRVQVGQADESPSWKMW